MPINLTEHEVAIVLPINLYMEVAALIRKIVEQIKK